MNNKRLKRYCDLMLVSIESRIDKIKDQKTKKDIEEKYYKFCTELTNYEFDSIGDINDLANRIEKIEENLYKHILII